MPDIARFEELYAKNEELLSQFDQTSGDEKAALRTEIEAHLAELNEISQDIELAKKVAAVAKPEPVAPVALAQAAAASHGEIKSPAALLHELDGFAESADSQGKVDWRVPVGSVTKWRRAAEAKDIYRDLPTGTPSSMGVVGGPYLVDVGYQTVALRDLSGVTPTTDRAKSFIQVTFDNQACPTAGDYTGGDFAAKAESNMTMVGVTESVETIAHFIEVSRRALREQAELDQVINNRLLQGLLVRENQQLLYGTGASNQLQGITTETGVQTRNWSAGETGDNRADAIHRGLVDIWTGTGGEDIQANGIALYPTDWQAIRLTKEANGYAFEQSMAAAGGRTLWDLPMVVTLAVTAGTAVVGAFGVGNRIFEQEAANIRMTDSHSDRFVKNAVTILAEESLVQTVDVPAAFCVVTFDSAPT